MARKAKLESLNIYKRAEEERIRKPASMDRAQEQALGAGVTTGLELELKLGMELGVSISTHHNPKCISCLH